MKILGSYSYSCLLRIIPTLCQLKNGSQRNITHDLLISNYMLFSSKQQRIFTNDHVTHDRTKYDHDVKLHTDGLTKTIISKSRELFQNFRDDFRANRKLKVYLFIL
ncbi:unnamed protein product [Rotaria sp. Silwood2]|nr:unnamed protein product [Rotaria sp. Silwood2]CAF4301868.1 unnamed protein product [Rotaria sp. Silwood2]